MNATRETIESDEASWTAIVARVSRIAPKRLGKVGVDFTTGQCFHGSPPEPHGWVASVRRGGMFPWQLAIFGKTEADALATLDAQLELAGCFASEGGEA